MMVLRYRPSQNIHRKLHTVKYWHMIWRAWHQLYKTTNIHWYSIGLYTENGYCLVYNYFEK